MQPRRTTTKPVEMAPMDIRRARIVLVGDSPLICHAWSAKAKQAILDKQMRKAAASAKKEAKDPEAAYQEALYKLPDGRLGFPAVAFKTAAVEATRNLDMTMTLARGAFHVESESGDLVALEYSEVIPRQDMVRIAGSTADIRIRPEFRDWRVTLYVRYNGQVLSLDQLATLFNTAGFAVGVGDWRPAKDGQFGMFHVEDAQEMVPGTEG